MDELGESSYPSFSLLAAETGLALRTVKSHIAVAAGAGWIGKRERRLPNSQGWRRVEYFPTIPAETDAMFHDEQRGAPESRERASEWMAREGQNDLRG